MKNIVNIPEDLKKLKHLFGNKITFGGIHRLKQENFITREISPDEPWEIIIDEKLLFTVIEFFRVSRWEDISSDIIFRYKKKEDIIIVWPLNEVEGVKDVLMCMQLRATEDNNQHLLKEINECLKK